ncbi:MAG: Uma2 family endonuclease [Acidobacteria bacterium]|nr:Uma2 family endonuclease [Acidobacteriota bacterium]
MPKTDRPVITAEELARLPDDGFRYELVDGELRTMSPSGFDHGAVVINVTAPVAQHVKARQLGVVCGAETGFRVAISPDTVLAPDLAFVARDRIPASGKPKGFFPGPPDLAVEVISPGDTPAGVKEKIALWLAAGTRLLWVVDPARRTVAVHRPGSARVCGPSDTLDGEEVVPGLCVPVADIFAD